MKCVSYTKLSQEITELSSIEAQNECVARLAMKYDLEVVKKYSDRKINESSLEAFQKLKENVISGNVNCIIFSSLNVFGKNVFKAITFIQRFLVPFGIQFGIADEGYISSESSKEEVIAYIKKRNEDYREASIIKELKTQIYNRHYEKYGYYYGEKGDELFIDEQAAKIIRDIFLKILDGKSTPAIADEFNSKGLLSPSRYIAKRDNPSASITLKPWHNSEVSKIARNQLYCGIWKRFYQGEEYILSCPKIVEQELFDEVQSLLDYRRNGEKRSNFTEAVFTRMIFDKNTGFPLTVMAPRPKTGGIYRLSPKYQFDVNYAQKQISESKIISLVKDRIQLEKENAVYAKKVVMSATGEKLRTSVINKLEKQLRSVIGEMMLLSEKYLPVQTDYENGVVRESEYIKDINELNRIMQCKESELTECRDNLANASLAFSVNNPWIKLYTSFDGRKEITRVTLKQYTGNILCEQFERMDIIIKEKNWKKLLPNEWTGEMNG